MREIMTGKDIGTTITFREFGRQAGFTHEAQHPWPEETIVSAGHGVVIRRGEGQNYRTLFMEVFPPGADFIRGEGKTAAECEDSAWKQYQNTLHCPGTADGSHLWEPRGYRNGAAFCAHCKAFRARHFSGEELGQFCRVCDVGTTYNWETSEGGEYTFTCQEHTPKNELTDEEALEAFFGADESDKNADN